jgi:hypothetical protein
MQWPIIYYSDRQFERSVESLEEAVPLLEGRSHWNAEAAGKLLKSARRRASKKSRTFWK